MTGRYGKPDVLLLMVDQMTVRAMSMYGNAVAKMPYLDKLASESVLFENAYCAAPLCAPARVALLTGRHPFSVNAFDNACEFPASIPTAAHYLRKLGYFSTLCGKMHFIGPDQLHGFDSRLMTDVYPSSYAWAPSWDKGPSYITSGVTCASIIEAGPCIRSLQIDYDDEVCYRSTQMLYDLARQRGRQSFFLTVSFTHPHHPFTITEEYWNRYAQQDIDLPDVRGLPFEQLDYHSRGLYFAHGRHLHDINSEHVRNARRAYFGMLSYLDDKIGHLLQVLEQTGLAGNTLVIFTSDHGEMLGERGMWHKHHFYEAAARVPLTLRLPGKLAPSKIDAPVSHIDLLPTLLDMLGETEPLGRLQGNSLMPALQGGTVEHPIFCDYLAIGPCVPCRMIRMGDHKYMYTHGHDEQMFNVSQDPDEMTNLAKDSSSQAVKSQLKHALFEHWDPDEIDQRVRASQRRRSVINMSPGMQPEWDFIYCKDDSKRFVRNRKVDDTKGKSRLPRVEPPPPTRIPMSTSQIAEAMQTGRLP